MADTWSGTIARLRAWLIEYTGIQTHSFWHDAERAFEIWTWDSWGIESFASGSTRNLTCRQMSSDQLMPTGTRTPATGTAVTTSRRVRLLAPTGMTLTVSGGVGTAVSGDASNELVADTNGSGVLRIAFGGGVLAGLVEVYTVNDGPRGAIGPTPAFDRAVWKYVTLTS